MLIGVISDTHIPERAKMVPQEVVNAFQGVDLILHAGDLVTWEALEPLERIARVIAVRGNMDTPEVREKLRAQVTMKTGKYRLGMTHGSGKPGDLVRRVCPQFERENVNIIVFGHSHEAFADWVDGVYMFNPGSATVNVSAKERSVGLLRIDEDGIRGTIVPMP